MALRALVKNTTKQTTDKTSVVGLFRSVIRELPRVMTIYDVDLPLNAARGAIAFHFRKHSGLRDDRVIHLLLAKGYMELEETLMQWKQKTHLLRILEPMELEKVGNTPNEIKERERLTALLNDPEYVANLIAAGGNTDAIEKLSQQTAGTYVSKRELSAREKLIAGIRSDL